MKRFGSKWRLLALPGVLTLSLVAVGCDREGPAEKAGEKLDRGVEKTGDSLERAGDRTRDRTTR